MNLMNIKPNLVVLFLTALGSGIGTYQLSLPSTQRQTARTEVLESKRNRVFNGEPIRPLPSTPPQDERKIELGKRLFFETRLSADNTVACVSCHHLHQAGADQGAVSRGVYGRSGKRNAPTVFNCGLNYRQFWDGRAATLEAQIEGPLLCKNEMGGRWPEVVRMLQSDADYARQFGNLYPGGIRPEAVSDAIATFERSLMTPNSRFDRFLKGDTRILTQVEQEGYRRFKRYGCASCHQGVNVGGNLMQPFGVMANPETFHYRTGEKFRMDATSLHTAIQSDPLFRVPGLRNVARTAPYFHDGSEKSLANAVRIMGDSQLGRPLSPEDITAIVAFLKTLTGTYAGKEL